MNFFRPNKGLKDFGQALRKIINTGSTDQVRSRLHNVALNVAKSGFLALSFDARQWLLVEITCFKQKMAEEAGVN